MTVGFDRCSFCVHYFGLSNGKFGSQMCAAFPNGFPRGFYELDYPGEECNSGYHFELNQQKAGEYYCLYNDLEQDIHKEDDGFEIIKGGEYLFVRKDYKDTWYHHYDVMNKIDKVKLIVDIVNNHRNQDVWILKKMGEDDESFWNNYLVSDFAVSGLDVLGVERYTGGRDEILRLIESRFDFE